MLTACTRHDFRVDHWVDPATLAQYNAELCTANVAINDNQACRKLCYRYPLCKFGSYEHATGKCTLACGPWKKARYLKDKVGWDVFIVSCDGRLPHCLKSHKWKYQFKCYQLLHIHKVCNWLGLEFGFCHFVCSYMLHEILPTVSYHYWECYNILGVFFSETGDSTLTYLQDTFKTLPEVFSPVWINILINVQDINENVMVSMSVGEHRQSSRLLGEYFEINWHTFWEVGFWYFLEFFTVANTCMCTLPWKIKNNIFGSYH